MIIKTVYYPFGMIMPGRISNSESYRYGFQNQESENDISSSTGSYSFFKYRISDNRLGRFFSVDPLSSEYPWNSSYAFSENKVIHMVELEGLEAAVPAGPIPLPILLPPNSSQMAKDSRVGWDQIKKDASKKVDEFKASNIIFVFTVYAAYLSVTSLFKDNPGWKEQQKRERESQNETNQINQNHDQSVENNIGSPTPDGTPTPKGGGSTVAKIVVGTGLTATAVKNSYETITIEGSSTSTSNNQSNQNNGYNKKTSSGYDYPTTLPSDNTRVNIQVLPPPISIEN